MTDKVFDELREADAYSWKWQGKQTIDFGGRMCEIDWPKLQEDLINALIKHYNEIRFSYGPEDEEEAEKWWPEIETKEALLEAITLESIVVEGDWRMEKGRQIYLLFSRAWGGEDLDDNGIGIHCINENIDTISYKEIAF